MICPYGLLIQNFSHSMNAEKLAKTCAVNNLILYLMVTQAIVTLKKNNLKHENHINLWTSGSCLAILLDQYVLKG